MLAPHDLATLQSALAHSDSGQVELDGSLGYFPWNSARGEFVEIGHGRKVSIGLTGVAHTLEAYRRLPFGWRTPRAVVERTAALEDWLRRLRTPGFAEELDGMLLVASRRAAEDYHLWARNEQLAVEALRSTRTWRLRERLVRNRLLRALLATLALPAS